MSRKKAATERFGAIITSASPLRVDREKREIIGFAVASLGPAVGHNVTLDEKTLDAIVALGNSTKLRSRVNHPNEEGEVSQDLEQLVGEPVNFRRDGNTVRADIKILDAAPKGDFLLKLAAEAPHLFGTSIVGDSKRENGALRPVKLFAVDFVDIPATNPAGLFAIGDKEISAMKELSEYSLEEIKAECMRRGLKFAAEAAPAKDDKEETAEVTAAAAKLNAEAIKADAVREEREYRKAFAAVMADSKIEGQAAVKFEESFYGSDLKQVKWLASQAIALRAKPVGEGNLPETDEKTKAKEAEAAAMTKRFGENKILREAFGVRGNDANSDEYKAGLKRYLGV